MSADLSHASSDRRPEHRDRYDAITITLHWVTAILVFGLFLMTLWWTYAPRAINLRFELEDLHVSFGIVFAIVLVARLVWRVIGGRHLPASERGVRHLLAVLVHAALYVLMVFQIGLGVVLRALQGADLSLFGLLTLPALFLRNRDVAELFDTLHRWTGWTIVMLAVGHALMALVHHYLLKNGVLRRMLPRACPPAGAR